MCRYHFGKGSQRCLGLCACFQYQAFFARDIMDDDAVPKHFKVPEPKPKPKPAPKPKAAANPGPKGQPRQEFRMVCHSGVTSEPVEQ